jgi:hypothetical protein
LRRRFPPHLVILPLASDGLVDLALNFRRLLPIDRGPSPLPALVDQPPVLEVKLEARHWFTVALAAHGQALGGEQIVEGCPAWTKK